MTSYTLILQVKKTYRKKALKLRPKPIVSYVQFSSLNLLHANASGEEGVPEKGAEAAP
jgi:hypothetical protein